MLGVGRWVKVKTLRLHYVRGEGGGIVQKHYEKHYVFSFFLFISKGNLNKRIFGFFLFNFHVLSTELKVEITETVLFPTPVTDYLTNTYIFNLSV